MDPFNLPGERATCDNFNFLTYHPQRGKWKVQPQRMARFWLDYCQAVHEGKVLDIAEKAEEYAPLISKFVFRYQDADDNLEPYTDSLVTKLVLIHQEVMKESLQIDDLMAYTCCILENAGSQPYIEGPVHEYTIVLHFPYCRLGLEYHSMLRERIITCLRKRNLFSELRCQPSGDWETIFERDTTTLPILLLGSTNLPGRPPCAITNIYSQLSEEALETGDVADFQLTLEDVFDVTKHRVVSQGLLTEQSIQQVEAEVRTEFFSPMFLSAHYDNKVTLVKDNQPTPQHQIERPADLLDPRTDPQALARHFLTLLKPQRYNEENTWRDIGMAIYNVFHGEEVGYELWASLGERHRNLYVLEDCDTWTSFNQHNTLTIRSLAWMAKEDNPAAYARWYNAWLSDGLEKALKITHLQVALCLYRMFWLELVYSTEECIWYYYKHPIWIPVKDPGCAAICGMIESRMMPKLLDLRTEASAKYSQTFENLAKEKLQQKIDLIGKLDRKLQDRLYINNVIKMASNFYFASETFHKSLNSNYNLTAVFNGVLQARRQDVIFRRGKPEDYLSKFSPVVWKEYHLGHHLVRSCLAWLEKVFPDPELLNYFLNYEASLFVARNSDKKLMVFTGDGNNSKSMIKKLNQAAFGSYCADLPTSFFTGRTNSSSAPSPEIAQAKDCRLLSAQEPDPGVEFKAGVVKGITGGDSFYARRLHDNGGSITATFKVALYCNNIPDFYRDKAMINRIRIVPFLSTWSDDAPLDPEEQRRTNTYPNDPNFEENIPSYAGPFLWLLVQQFPRYRRSGLVTPKIVERYTSEYWDDRDLYLQFKKQRLESADNLSLALNDLYRDFKNWFMDFYPNDRIPNLSTIKREMEARLGPCKATGFPGWRLRFQAAGLFA